MESEPIRRTAAVTGGAQGLGAAVATRLAGQGVALALLDVQEDLLQRTRKQIEHRFADVEVHAITADLADDGSVESAFAELDERFGRLDILVNAAGGSGVVPVREIEDLTTDVWRRVLDDNVTTAYLCSRFAVPIMRRNGYGRIVNFSSAVANGLSGPSGTVGARLPYAASKAAVVGFTRQLAKDLGGSGITVNAVSPGLVVPEAGRIRDRFESLPEADQVAVRAAIPAGRTGTEEEIAAAVAYLASEEAGFTSGAVLGVDGAAS
jgi:NAD(P)-dependent dehydrogenase (short-subunit alcohol dehydrogenase family)